MDATQINSFQARLAALNSNLDRPESNPFLYGGIALEFVTAQEERAAQTALRSLPPFVLACIRMESGTGFPRLLAAAFQCSADLKAAAQLVLQQRAPEGLDWDRLLAMERQCNLWARDAFYVMNGVQLQEDTKLLQSHVVARALDLWRRNQVAAAAAAQRWGLPPSAPVQRGWAPPPSAPAPSQLAPGGQLLPAPALSLGCPPTPGPAPALSLGCPPTPGTAPALSLGCPPTPGTAPALRLGCPPTPGTAPAPRLGCPPTPGTAPAPRLGCPPTPGTAPALSLGCPPNSGPAPMYPNCTGCYDPAFPGH